MNAMNLLSRCLMKMLRPWQLLVFALVCVIMLRSVREIKSQQSEAAVPAMFVFGDSLVDDGNNNYLLTLAKANFYPNGIDFPQGPTGRFCNGRTVVDFLGEWLGLPFIPPYLDPSTRGQRILTGVNFASAASGILNETGQALGARLSFDVQVANFKNTYNNLVAQLSNATEVSSFLSKSIFFVSFGSNDYINNYLSPDYDSSRRYSPQAFRDLLITEYSRQLTTLYKLGGRRFVVPGVGALGCIPNQLAMANTDNGHCIDSINDLVVQFNAGIRSLLSNFNENLRGAIFVFADSYKASLQMILNPHDFGFTVANVSCCGGGRYKGQIPCVPPVGLPCPNRKEYVFWDPFHPTEAFNYLMARRIYQGSPNSDVYPINLVQLVQRQQ